MSPLVQARACLEQYPLAKRYGWKAPKKLQERSLDWHLENDGLEPLGTPTPFMRERQRFHERKARRMNGSVRHTNPRRGS